MEDLRKGVNYDLRNCSNEQLEKICEWLVKNDERWSEIDVEKIKDRERCFISFHDGEFRFYYKVHYQIICATTLFDNNNVHRFNVDKEIAALMEASKKQGLKAVVTFELL